MKKTIFLIFSLLLIYFIILCSILSCKRELTQNKFSLENSEIPAKSTLSIFSTSELSELTAQWANEFSSLNPEVTIKVAHISETSIAEKFDKTSNLIFTSGELDTTFFNKSNWKEVVGRDVIVPIVNSRNPFINEIISQGISFEVFTQVINDPELRNWGTLLKNQQNIPVNLYFTDDASTNSGLEKLLNVNQININGMKVGEGEDFISAVQRDPYSIGITKLTNILDFNNQSFFENIKLLPIDKNDNGKIDYWENIYDDSNVLLRGVWIGKYPMVLSNNIYSISASKPTNKTEQLFLKWILTDGQKFLNNYGYNDLIQNERLAKVDLIDGYKVEPIATNNYTFSKKALLYFVYLPLIVFLFFLIVILAINGIQYMKSIMSDKQDISFAPNFVFNESFIEKPQGLYYDKTHTWAFMEKDGVVMVGVDDFLQHTTGPLTSVKMKYPGERVKKGKKILSISQAGKQLDIYAPFSGIIKEQNKVLTTNASLINSSPYTDGWVYKIEPTNWLKEIRYLFMGEKYKEWLKSEFSRLKDFFSVYVNPEKVKYAHILQDGGELKDGILVDFGPEVWEDFQTSFIDVSF